MRIVRITVMLVILVLFYILSLPLVVRTLASWLETTPPVDLNNIKHSQTLVVLGGGIKINALEYGGDTLSDSSLARLHYGVYLARRTTLPLLVSGGDLHNRGISEAKLMADSLSHDYLLEAQFVENRSQNTWDNARYSWEILSKAGIDNVILVTHALHMRRAMEAFHQVGFLVTPAPLGFRSTKPPLFKFTHVLPSAEAISLSAEIIHEIVAIFWYRSHHYRNVTLNP